MEFKANVIQSFRKARMDIDTLSATIVELQDELASVKKNTNDWVLFLVKENKDLKEKLVQMEREAQTARLYI